MTLVFKPRTDSRRRRDPRGGAAVELPERGQRSNGGGRAAVRRTLHMATLLAVRHNAERLLAASAARLGIRRPIGPDFQNGCSVRRRLQPGGRQPLRPMAPLGLVLDTRFGGGIGLPGGQRIFVQSGIDLSQAGVQGGTLIVVALG